MVFLLDVHRSVMLFFAGDMCSGTMRMEFKTQHENIPSCATQQNIRHRSINTSDKSYFHHSLSTCHDIVRGMMRWINKKQAPLIQSVLDFQEKSYPRSQGSFSLSLSLSHTISPNKKKQYKTKWFIQLPIFLFTNSPHQSLKVPFIKTPAFTTPRHHGVQLHLFSLWILQLNRPQDHLAKDEVGWKTGLKAGKLKV